ncbi:enoyl-CoA hydratase [Chachezhania sediminis]|uniref:enoyl-CoA hydratase n=1 Tax=Chachezhania sediminis TaxID=2599291 RepID=UPI00131B90E8|nr:enoyl-CoA hydratase [Chachezhania sediminis]
MTDQVLQQSTADGVLTLAMNRPDALNSLSRALKAAMVAALKVADADAGIRAIVITGRGRAFCAGLDLKELGSSGAPVGTSLAADTNLGDTLAAVKKPVIAAVNGLAVTGGFELALACDMCLAGRSAWFGDTHAKFGLIPGWGLSQRLPRLIGPHRAKEISLTGRRVTAEEAERLGFINRCVDDADLGTEAQALAAAAAAFDPANVAAMKKLIDDGYAMPFGEAMEFEDRAADANNGGVAIRPGAIGSKP